MTTIPILINKTTLEIEELYPIILEYIQEYINYKLMPYKKTGKFSFNSFSDTPNPIDGLSNPKLLISTLEHHVVNCPYLNSTTHYESGIYFMNAHTQLFNITQNEFDKICNSPSSYCVIFTNIHE